MKELSHEAEWLVAVGAAMGFLMVALGAFGAHALRDRLPDDRVAHVGTAAHYGLVHALAIIVCGLSLATLGGWANTAGHLFAIGVVVFSGSLVVLALTGRRRWGMVTPVGGVFLLAGWGYLFAAAWDALRSSTLS